MTDRQSTQPKRRGGCFWWILTPLALGLLAWFAPAIIANTSLRQRILPTLAADYPGLIQTGAAKLSWFSPVVLSDVKATDAQGEPLLEVESITSEKTLLALITETGHPGLFHLKNLHLHITLRDDGSNLEDTLAPLLASQGESAPLDCGVELIGAVIEIQETHTGRHWQITQLAANVDYTNDGSRPLTATAEGTISSDQWQPGAFQVELTWQPPLDPQTGGLGQGQIALRCDSLPLQALSAPLARCGVEAQTAGVLSADCTYSFGGAEASHALLIDVLETRNLQITAPQWLGEDTLRLARLDVSGQLSLDAELLTISALKLDSDLMALQANGSVSVTQLSSDRVVEALQQQDFQIVGQIDLAALAKVLPATLQIRQGTEITAGSIDLSAYSSLQQGLRRWQADIQAKNLAATNNGQPITWSQPIQITLSAFQSPEGPVIEELLCQASFLSLSAEGTLAEGKVTAEGNLDRLAEELGRFVDLDQQTLAGAFSVALDWRRDDQQQFEAEGTVELLNLEFVTPGRRPWREKHLSAQFDASGLADKNGLRRIDSGQFNLRSGEDSLNVELVRPVVPVTAKSQWPLTLKTSGEFASWTPRIQVFLPLTGWEIEGGFDIQADALCSASQIEFQQVRASLRQLRAHSDSIFIDEEEIHIDATGSWRQEERQLRLSTATLQSSALAFRADEVTLSVTDSGPQLEGRLVYRGDLARMMGWFHDPSAPVMSQLYGQLTGQAQLSYNAGVTQAQWSAEIERLVYASRPAKSAGGVGLATTPAAANELVNIWQEKTLNLSGSGSYRIDDGSVRLTDCAAETDWLRLSTSGALANLTTDCRVDLQGQAQYDLKEVAKKLRPYIGQNFQISGSDTRPFAIKGPLLTRLSTSNPASSAALLVPDELIASASVAWESAEAQGLTLGQGQLDAQLAEGIIRVLPLDVKMGQGQETQGRLTMAPRIVLNATPLALQIDSGPLFQHVQIEPEMCQTWLKYIAPLLADATRAEGRFSLNLDGADVPLSDPTTADVSGKLIVHSAQIGPGPLGQQIALIAQQIKAIIDRRPLQAATASGSSQWINIPAQEVSFLMKDGRVQHQNLEMIVGDVTLRTSGSVGMDQTLSMVIEAPIQDKWVERDRLLASLKGQVLKIPIRGTLSHPKVDSRALQDLSKQIITGSAGKLLENEINRGLQRLFGPSN